MNFFHLVDKLTKDKKDDKDKEKQEAENTPSEQS